MEVGWHAEQNRYHDWVSWKACAQHSAGFETHKQIALAKCNCAGNLLHVTKWRMTSGPDLTSLTFGTALLVACLGCQPGPYT